MADCQGVLVKGGSGATKATLVSKDGAFWDVKAGSIQEGLVRELEAGLPRDAISAQSNLQDVIDALISSRLQTAEWIEVAIEGGQIGDFSGLSENVLLEATDWICSNPNILDFDDYLFVEIDIVEAIALDCVERAFELGSGEVLVESRWTCDVSADGHTNRYFGDMISVELKLELSSIIEADNGRLTVRSHEVTGMEVVNVVDVSPD